MIVRWDSTGADGVLIDDNMDPRTLIYHDEINMRTDGSSPSQDGPGVLLCRYSATDSNAGWRRPDGNGINVGNNDGDFRQFRSGGNPTRIQLARARDPLQDGASNNGLWTCNGGALPPHHLALYARGIV